MNHFDCLSLTPNLYLSGEKRGRNNLVGIFSLVYILFLILIILGCLGVYFSGINYRLKYVKDFWLHALKREEIDEPREFLLNITRNENNAVITPILVDEKGQETDMLKCKDLYDDDSFGPYSYCFNLSFYHLPRKGFKSFLLTCKENCDGVNGRPAAIEISLFTTNYLIDHDKKNPFSSLSAYGDNIQLIISNNSYRHYLLEFTPIIYKTTEMFKSGEKKYVRTSFNNIKESFYDVKLNYFAGFSSIVSTNVDIYQRRYITLLEALSNMGGLSIAIKVIFTTIIMFYSNLNNNFEITKRVILKTNIYKNNLTNKTKITSIPSNNIDYVHGQKELEQKININTYEHFFWSFVNFMNCSKKRRTMKILNLCDNFVRDYLSADNIIFNMLLFEQYYEENPIPFKTIKYLKELNLETENQENKEETGNKEENNIMMSPLNDT